MSVQKDAKSHDSELKSKILPIFDGVDFYKNTFQNAGIVLIFNQIKFDDGDNPERKGAEVDSKKLKDVFIKCGFTVKICEDYTREQIEKELKRVSRLDHKNNNCLIVVMMSHGDNEKNIIAKDGEMKVDVLWKYFDGSRCPELCGKPKFFFVQACRGSSPDFGMMHEYDLDDEEEKRLSKIESGKTEFRKIPIMADILVMFSSADGYPAFRENTGAWFIDALCNEFKRYLSCNANDDVMTMLTRVNRDVAYTKEAYDPTGDCHGLKQMPVIMSMLTKNFRFNRNHIIEESASSVES